ncbi:MAG: GreA/GreB family elongation factor [Pirellulales bacterium]|nr:GreA/GreB family elongation factor [Pirellulales bacterium]
MSDQFVQKIQTGMWAKVRGAMPGQEKFEAVFHFVPNDQVDLDENKISIDSPLGQTLSGAKVGDKAQLETKNGVLGLLVLDLGRV